VSLAEIGSLGLALFANVEALAEALDTAGGVEHALRARVEWVAL
jgi:hypothetical protein